MIRVISAQGLLSVLVSHRYLLQLSHQIKMCGQTVDKHNSSASMEWLRQMGGAGGSLDSPAPTLAYVTYQDIRAVSNFKEQTVIAVKAPPQTRLEVPDSSEVRGEAFGGEQG